MVIFTLSKLIPLLILPLGFCLILLILKSKFKRKLKFSNLVPLIILTLFSLGVVADYLWRLVEHPWQRIHASQAPNADAIVVLSGGMRHQVPGESNINEWNDPDRFIAGIKLFKSRKSSILIFTGGDTPLNPLLENEGLTNKKEALLLGIPRSSLIVTDNVKNTAEEAREISKLLKNKFRNPKILLVTSAFHMKRAKKIFEREGLDVLPFPVDFKTKNINRIQFNNPYDYFPNASSLEKSSRALRELLGRLIYRTW